MSTPSGNSGNNPGNSGNAPGQTGSLPPGQVGKAQNPNGKFANAPTWLCRFRVLVDMPNTMATSDMEAAIAGAVAVALTPLGLPANVSVTLEATAGNVTLTNVTPGVDLGVTQAPQGSPI